MLILDIKKITNYRQRVVGRVNDLHSYKLELAIYKNGEPLDLNGYTVTFEGLNASGFKVIGGSASTVDKSKGLINFRFPDKAFAVSGVFKEAYFRLKKGSISDSTENFTLEVLSDIGLNPEEVGDIISLNDEILNEINRIKDEAVKKADNAEAKAEEANGRVDNIIKGQELNPNKDIEVMDARQGEKNLGTNLSNIKKGIANSQTPKLTLDNGEGSRVKGYNSLAEILMPGTYSVSSAERVRLGDFPVEATSFGGVLVVNNYITDQSIQRYSRLATDIRFKTWERLIVGGVVQVNAKTDKNGWRAVGDVTKEELDTKADQSEFEKAQKYKVTSDDGNALNLVKYAGDILKLETGLHSGTVDVSVKNFPIAINATTVAHIEVLRNDLPDRNSVKINVVVGYNQRTFQGIIHSGVFKGWQEYSFGNTVEGGGNATKDDIRRIESEVAKKPYAADVQSYKITKDDGVAMQPGPADYKTIAEMPTGVYTFAIGTDEGNHNYPDQPARIRGMCVLTIMSGSKGRKSAAMEFMYEGRSFVTNFNTDGKVNGWKEIKYDSRPDNKNGTNEVIRRIQSAARYDFLMPIITDSHFQDMPKANQPKKKIGGSNVSDFSETSKQVGADLKAHLGDYMDGGVDIAEALSDTVETLDDLFDNEAIPTSVSNGNHDGNGLYWEDFDYERKFKFIGKEERRKIIKPRIERMGGIYDRENDFGEYHAFDIKDKKIMVITLDTTDLPVEKSDKYDPHYVLAISAAQVKWLEKTLLAVPDDYHVFILSHYTIGNMYKKDQNMTNGNKVHELLKAFQSSSKVKSGLPQETYDDLPKAEYAADITADFSGKKSRRIGAMFNGHHHRDKATVADGINIIQLLCALPENTDTEPTAEKPLRENYTYTQQAFDIMTFTKKTGTIKLYRVGAGADRVFTIPK